MSTALPGVQERTRRRGRVRRVVVLLACVVVAWFAYRFAARVDWASVRASLGKFSAGELGVLVLLLLVRQVLNALPLALFTHGVGLYRAVVNDQTAALVSVVAPPPSDVVLRLRMFGSWGIPPTAGLAGTVTNTVVFYVVRFSVPLLGVALLLSARSEAGPVVLVLLSSTVAATILAATLMSVRRESTAAKVGETTGRLAGRFRPTVNSSEWSAAAVTFRRHVVNGFESHLWVSLAGLLVMVLTDATIVLLSLRFVGVTAADVPALDVYAAFCILYPLTLFPLAGLGILDALLLSDLLDVGGSGIEAAAIAALVVWRAVTLGGPITLGGVCLAAWRLGLVPPRPDAEPAT